MVSIQHSKRCNKGSIPFDPNYLFNLNVHVICIYTNINMTDSVYEHNGKTRKIRELPKDELELLIDKSESTAGILRNLGYTPKTCYYKAIRAKFKEYDLNEPT